MNIVSDSMYGTYHMLADVELEQELHKLERSHLYEDMGLLMKKLSEQYIHVKSDTTSIQTLQYVYFISRGV